MEKDLNIGLGIIAGAAIGDALGAPLEFLPARDHDNWVTDLVGGGVLKWKPGETTDDTTMALSIMDMYLEKGEYNQEYIVQKWIDWRNTNPKDIGNWTYKVLSKWKQYQTPGVKRGEQNPAVILWKMTGSKNAGNGAVMRCMPTAVARRNDIGLLYKETFWLAEDTHPDPRCLMSCLVVNRLLQLAFTGIGKIKAYDTVLDELRVTKANPEIVSVMEDIPFLRWEDWDNNGFTTDTVKCAIAAWFQSESFEDGLTAVVNRGNDSDTVGAVAGALLGAYWGFENIPQRWWNGLEENTRNSLVKNTKGLLELGK